MSKIRLLRSRTVQELKASVATDLERYRSGNFDFLESDSSNFFEAKHDANDSAFAKVYGDKENHREVECCAAIYEAMGAFPPYLARDDRLWTYLTHTTLLEYSRKRWPIPEDDEAAVSHIKKHLFVAGTRGIERDNAASRLWWMAALCSRVKGLPLTEALTVFLHQYDVRANIIERPTTSQSIPIFSAVIKQLAESYKTKEKKLFERTKFRELMKQLNLRGGVTLLGALNSEQLESIVEECAK